MNNTVRVIIKRDENMEYRVPAPDGREAGAYYTDDKDDAIGTVNYMYKGVKVLIQFRNVSGYHNG